MTEDAVLDDLLARTPANTHFQEAVNVGIAVVHFAVELAVISGLRLAFSDLSKGGYVRG